MSAPFLITGLPRSRTAWMSALANTVPGAICYHEPLVEFGTWQDSLALWRNADRRWVGVSDSGMARHLAPIMETVRPRTLIIERNPTEAVRALERLFPAVDATDIVSQLRAKLSAVAGHPLVRAVPFEDLAEPAIVVDALRWLMPGAEISVEKVIEFGRMRIEADMDRVRRAAASMSVERARALLGDE